MHLSANELVGLLDRIGIVAFALSGVEVGARRRFDVFGLLVIGIVTATGGGLMRDVVLEQPPRVLERWDYLVWAAVASVAGIMLVAIGRRVQGWLLMVSDAAGLGAFATAGALAGVHVNFPATAVVVLAILTATGGGVIRDVLADRVPMVLRTEVNATAAAIAGLVVYFVEPQSPGLAAIAGVAVAAGLRVASMAMDLHLPRLKMEPTGESGDAE